VEVNILARGLVFLEDLVVFAGRKKTLDKYGGLDQTSYSHGCGGGADCMDSPN